MWSRRFKYYADVLSAAIAVVILDIMLHGYFLQTNTNYNNAFILADAIIITAAAAIGKEAAKQSGLPVWQASCAEAGSRRRIIVSILIGIVIVGINTFILYNHDTDMIPWLSFTNMYQPLLLAIRASLTEEIAYRLFIFSMVFKFANKISRLNAVCFVSAALISSIAFGMLHSGFGFYLAFIFGILLCYIYKNTGLIIPMVIHFLADFIPWTLFRLY